MHFTGHPCGGAHPPAAEVKGVEAESECGGCRDWPGLGGNMYHEDYVCRDCWGTVFVSTFQLFKEAPNSERYCHVRVL